jgi:hypothetical protein
MAIAWLDGNRSRIKRSCLGTREDVTRLWLRWCDRDGQVIPTGAERAATERQRAEQAESQLETERQRAERLAERLRAMGINPDEV